MCVTCQGQRLDAGLHLSSVLLLQPRTVQQPDGGLQQLDHNGVMSLMDREGNISTDRPTQNPSPRRPAPHLQRRAVLRERRAEEGVDGVKHHVDDVLLQDGVR